MAQFWETGANSQNSTFQCCTLQDKLQFQIIWIWTNCCFSSDLGQIPIPKNAKFKSTNYKHLHLCTYVIQCARAPVCLCVIWNSSCLTTPPSPRPSIAHCVHRVVRNISRTLSELSLKPNRDAVRDGFCLLPCLFWTLPAASNMGCTLTADPCDSLVFHRRET